MNPSVLFMMCDQFYQMTGIPVCLFENGAVSYVVPELTFQNLMKDMFSSSRCLDYLDLSHVLAAAGFAVEDSDYFIIAGPVVTSSVSEMQIREILKENHLSADEKTLGNIAASKRWSLHSFRTSASFLYMAFNHELPQDAAKERTDPVSAVHPSEDYEAEWAEYNDDYTQSMCFLIENGMTEELQALMKREKPAPYGTLSKDHLRHWKNSCFVLLYMVRKAAERGGLARVSGLKTAEMYSQKIDAADDVTKLNETVCTMRMDYCQQVSELKGYSAASSYIRTAMRYIREHRGNRLPLDEIAEAAGVSVSHLCAQFKKETGITVNAYVQQEKTVSAQQMLRFTDLSAAEIAGRLAYSSQSHFQTAFRKQTGMTPGQYRKAMKEQNENPLP